MVDGRAVRGATDAEGNHTHLLAAATHDQCWSERWLVGRDRGLRPDTTRSDRCPTAGRRWAALKSECWIVCKTKVEMTSSSAYRKRLEIYGGSASSDGLGTGTVR